VVRRLVQQQNMGNISSQFCKHNATLLTVRKLRHFLDLHLSRNTKATQVLSLFVVGIIGVVLRKEFEWRLFQIENVDKVLGESTHFQMPVWSNVTTSRCQLPSH